MNIQNDVIGLALHGNCKSKQVTDFIAWPSRCHGRIYVQSQIFKKNETQREFFSTSKLQDEIKTEKFE
jgi:hypothetical protein